MSGPAIIDAPDGLTPEVRREIERQWMIWGGVTVRVYSPDGTPKDIATTEAPIVGLSPFFVATTREAQSKAEELTRFTAGIDWGRDEGPKRSTFAEWLTQQKPQCPSCGAEEGDKHALLCKNLMHHQDAK